jgi:hypothetical protein
LRPGISEFAGKISSAASSPNYRGTAREPAAIGQIGPNSIDLGLRIGLTMRARSARPPDHGVVGRRRGQVMPQRGAGEETATMSYEGRTRKRRDRAPRGGVRHGDATGSGKDSTKAASRGKAGFSFSNEGLALIGLHRGHSPAPGGKRATG